MLQNFLTFPQYQKRIFDRFKSKFLNLITLGEGGLKIERLISIFMSQVGQNLKIKQFSSLKILLNFLDLALNFCMWSQYLYRSILKIATWYLRQLFFYFLTGALSTPHPKLFISFQMVKTASFTCQCNISSALLDKNLFVMVLKQFKLTHYLKKIITLC